MSRYMSTPRFMRWLNMAVVPGKFVRALVHYLGFDGGELVRQNWISAEDPQKTKGCYITEARKEAQKGARCSGRKNRTNSKRGGVPALF